MTETDQIATDPAPPSTAAVVAIIGLAIFTCWITWRAKKLESSLTPSSRPLALIHKPAPDFTLPSLDGKAISLAGYRSQKRVVVSFWASWCGPCRLELPVLKSFYEKAHKQDADFEFLAINLDEDRESAATATTKLKLPFPVLLDPQHRVADAYGVYGIPALFVIDKTGHVSFGETGFNITLEEALAQQLGVDPRLIFPAGGPNAAARH